MLRRINGALRGAMDKNLRSDLHRLELGRSRCFRESNLTLARALGTVSPSLARRRTERNFQLTLKDVEFSGKLTEEGNTEDDEWWWFVSWFCRLFFQQREELCGLMVLID